ncbi:MAG: hypothetical protein J2P52_06175 [Blastocatellia bacterium]|nr:hypothetical protein [Blastocatellia bacterium]
MDVRKAFLYPPQENQRPSFALMFAFIDKHSPPNLPFSAEWLKFFEEETAQEIYPNDTDLAIKEFTSPDIYGI